MDEQSDETYEKIKKDLMKENNYLKKTMRTMQKQIAFLVLKLDEVDKLASKYARQIEICNPEVTFTQELKEGRRYERERS